MAYGMKRSTGSEGKPALDLIEEATQLLRSAGPTVLITYYVGSVPAMIGFLYFFSDMSRGAFARSRLIEAALGAAALYLWMKCWHAVFARGLRARLSTEAMPRWTMARVFRLMLVQVAVQPTGLFARFIAGQIIVPYVWVYAFYQNVGVLGDGETADVRDVSRRAAAYARLWPRQAHYALLLSFILAFFIALNVGVAIFIAPKLLKTFFGIETVFSRSPTALLNTTIFATIAAITYLCFDPLRKTLFVLRCFYGASLQSGDDLKVELRTIKKNAKTAPVAAALALLCALPMASLAATAPTAPAPVSARELDSSIEHVLQRREYTWRMPREKIPAAEKGWLTAFVEDSFKVLNRWVKRGWDLVERGFEKLRRWFGRSDGEDREKSGWGVAAVARPALYATTALIVILLGVLLWRARKLRRGTITSASAIAPVPDLRSENVVADQLPADGWLKLARELMDAGELRLALRASYLAALAHLGSRHLITVARHKSNRDYGVELRRRARARDELIAAFDASVSAFESAWYGWHDVTLETLGGFNQNLETIRAC